MTTTADRHLGSGLVTPFRRESGKDFVWATGVDYVGSVVRQILGVNPGDLPWAPSEGGGLARLLHQNITEDLRRAAEAQLIAAITRYASRVRIVSLYTEAAGEALRVQIQWALRLGIDGSVEVPGTTDIFL